MPRKVLTLLALSAIGLFAARSASAQFPYGYGPYAWGGWGAGGGATVAGDMARGIGYFAAGAGSYNLQSAQAAAINTDTVMRWNEALYEAQQQRNVNYSRTIGRRRAELDQAQAAIYERLRDHPEAHDIESGDALNVQLDILLNPKVYRQTIGLLTTSVSRELIREVPFEHASEGFSVSLNELTGDDGWPLALRGSAFAADRKELHEAIEAALAEDVKGDLTPESIARVETAVAAMRREFERTVPIDSPDYHPAHDHLKALAGMVRMLHSPHMDAVLAGLQTARSTSLGDLLGFMHAYNLRFGAARTPRQIRIYQELYPLLAEAPKALPESAAKDVGQIAARSVPAPPAPAGSLGKSLGSAAKSFFGGMDWSHLEPPK